VRVFLYIFTVIILAGCSNYQKVLKNGTPQEKLEAAKKYYNNKEYFKAQPLFEELLGLYYGRTEREEIYFYFAYTHYGLGEYLLAGYHFKYFTQTYGLSPKREEAAYMHAICEFQKSMAPELDQTPTKDAITSLQAFINQYPNSKYVEECNTKIDELRGRILIKIYNNAKLYYNTSQYKSAIVACTNALDDYPDMINREELGYLIVDASYSYAKNSITKMQEERYEKTITAIKTFYKEYNSEKLFEEEVKKLEEKTNKDLKELRDNTAFN
jgi:outer membrane protein assembly factor BamD